MTNWYCVIVMYDRGAPRICFFFLGGGLQGSPRGGEENRGRYCTIPDKYVEIVSHFWVFHRCMIKQLNFFT